MRLRRAVRSDSGHWRTEIVFGVVFVFVFVFGFVFERTVIVVTGRVEAEDEHEDDTGRGA